MRLMEPPDDVARRMKDRAAQLCGGKPGDKDPPAGSMRAEIARALIEAWTEGAFAAQERSR